MRELASLLSVTYSLTAAARVAEKYILNVKEAFLNSEKNNHSLWYIALPSQCESQHEVS